MILGCCKTNAQRSFYMEPAAEKKLSKLALMRTIASETFEATSEEAVAKNATTVFLRWASLNQRKPYTSLIL